MSDVCVLTESLSVISALLTSTFTTLEEINVGRLIYTVQYNRLYSTISNVCDATVLNTVSVCEGGQPASSITAVLHFLLRRLSNQTPIIDLCVCLCACVCVCVKIAVIAK